MSKEKHACIIHNQNWHTGCIECQHVLIDYIQKLEQQNEEMIELFFLVKDRISDFEYDVNRQSFIHELIENDLEKITGKSIDEVIR